MRFKYPRTPHLPWSPGFTDDDVRASSADLMFAGKTVVVTEKMDGENTTLYRDGMHARSLDSGHHPSRSFVKLLHAQIRQDIPEGWRICGENLYAKHSIHYTNLISYFQVFSIWNENNQALSWDDTVEWCELLGLNPVRVLYRGLYNEQVIRVLVDESRLPTNFEGYVVRNAESFGYSEFAMNVAKFVRANHVQSGDHWMNQELVANKLQTSE
jgi:ATP-dependent RNA circularization protein (DNA/RNA ligase family)